MLTAVLLCVLRCRLRRNKLKGRVDISALNNLGLVHASLGDGEMGRSAKNEWQLVKEDSSLLFSDPLEFPRSKLFVSNTMLGKTFFVERGGDGGGKREGEGGGGRENVRISRWRRKRSTLHQKHPYSCFLITSAIHIGIENTQKFLVKHCRFN